MIIYQPEDEFPVFLKNIIIDESAKIGFMLRIHMIAYIFVLFYLSC